MLYYNIHGINLYAKFVKTILYKSPRGSVLRTPATLTGIRTFPFGMVAVRLKASFPLTATIPQGLIK